MPDITELDVLLIQIQSFGHLKLGRGPNCPDKPNFQIADELAAFLERFSFVVRDEGYVQFLQTYAGGVFWRDQDALSLGLFGFDADLSIHLTKGPGKPVEYGCLTFCDMVIPPRSDPFAAKALGLGFGFEATGARRWGLYRIWPGGRVEWFCDSFIAWLRRFVAHEGRLDEAEPET
jgi:hypothetical protein